MVITQTVKCHCALEIIKSKKNIRMLIEEESLTYDDVLSISARLKSIGDEMEAQHEALLAERKLKMENIKKVRNLMEENGVSLSDLQSPHVGLSLVSSSSKRGPRRPIPKVKIRYLDESGKEIIKERALIGALSKDLETFLNKTGKRLEDLVISEPVAV